MGIIITFFWLKSSEDTENIIILLMAEADEADLCLTIQVTES